MTDASRWVGIDLHRRRSHIAIVDEHGELAASRRIANDRDAFLELLGDAAAGETHVALEATYGWEWLAELLEEAGYDLHLAHPLRTRAIAAARVKTDAIDARTLAQLLRAGMLPEAYIAPRELRDLRELLRHRATLTRMRSAVKNRVHAILAKHGIIHQHSDLFGNSGRQFLAALELRDAPRRRLDSLMALIEDFDRDHRHHPRDRATRPRRRPRRRALPDPRRRPLHRPADHRRDRRRHTLPDRPARLFLGRPGADGPQLRRQSPARAHLPPTDRRRCAGHSSRPPRRSPPDPARCARSSNGSPNAAAARSPRSRSPARSSPCPPTAYATERSVAWRAAAPARARKRSWRPSHDARRALTQHDLRPRPRRDPHARASSTFVMASLTTRRPPT